MTTVQAVAEGIEEAKKATEEEKDEVAVVDGGDDEEKEDGLQSPSSKRRFFPRVKHLLTREWETFLGGVLDAMEESGAAHSAAASHKATNPWYKAFDLVYGGVAADCSVPTGKNRFHKFKDKIVELWTAMEAEAPDDHPLKPRAVQQLAQYRMACEEASKAESANPAKSAIHKSLKKTPTSTSMSSSGKRSFNNFQPSQGRVWKHLNESLALEKLPEPLKSLVNLRHMGTEIGAYNVKSSVEFQHSQALEQYLAEATPSPDQAYEKSQVLVTLYRLSHNSKEAKDILQAYERTVQDYMAQLEQPTAAASSTTENVVGL